MPIATNPNTGEVVYQDDKGDWQPAKTAVNPDTREMRAYDGKDWVPVTSHGPGILGHVDDAIRSIASGMTFGYADKIAAGMESLTGIGGKQGSYEQNLQKERARTESVPAAIKIPGEIAGTVATTVAAAPIAAATKVGQAAAALPAAVRAIGGGALGGALYGSSQSDGGVADKLASAAGGAATGAVTGGTLYGAGSLIGKVVGAAGDKIMTSVIKPLKADVEDGFSLETIKKYNLGGSLRTTLSKTQELMNSISSQLRDKLTASKATVDLTDVYDQTQRSLLSENKLKSFGANAKIQSALDNLQNEVLSVSEGRPLSIPDAQVVKQAAGHFGAWQYGRPDPDSKASEIVFNTFYNKLKTAIEDNSPEGVKELNQQLSKLIPVSNAVIRRLPVAERNAIISLPEWISLVGATAHPGALGMTGLSLMSRSGAAGNVMSKAGSALQGSGTIPAVAGSIAGQFPMIGRPSALGPP